MPYRKQTGRKLRVEMGGGKLSIEQSGNKQNGKTKRML